MEYPWENHSKYKKEFDHAINRTSQMVTIPRGFNKKKYDIGYLLWQGKITFKQYKQKLKKLNKEYEK